MEYNMVACKVGFDIFIEVGNMLWVSKNSTTLIKAKEPSNDLCKLMQSVKIHFEFEITNL